jgi:hypothetical protein
MAACTPPDGSLSVLLLLRPVANSAGARRTELVDHPVGCHNDVYRVPVMSVAAEQFRAINISPKFQTIYVLNRSASLAAERPGSSRTGPLTFKCRLL